jgi:hypothetical protein
MPIIRKYADLTLPTPAYGGKVYTCFSPSKWKHFLVDKDTGALEPLDGVTGVLKRAVDKSQPLMRWAVRLALARVRALILETGIGGDGAIQIFTEELDKILESARKADTEALETAGDIGHQAHAIIEQIIKGIIAKDDRRMDEVFSTLPDDPRVVNAVIAFVSWLDTHNVRFIKTEFRALSLKHKCCGTADGLAYCDSCNDKECCPNEFKDRLSLIDHKTSNGLYTTYLFQTAFYVAAHEEEFPEIGLIQDRWVNRLDKETAEFDPWHAAGRDAQAEDLHGFLCCLAVCRALDATENRMRAITDARKAVESARKLLEKQAQDRIECPKFKDYAGKRLSKCLADGTQCAACSAKYKENHP